METGQAEATGPSDYNQSSTICSVNSSITHHRIDPTEWDNQYIIGDVHGCYTELHALLTEIDPCPSDLIVFVGDLVRKGPDSSRVVDLVRSTPNMLSVFGNNEQKVLSGIDDGVFSKGQIRFLESLPDCISWPGSVVVHGGIDPGEPLSNQDRDTLLTMRSIPPGNGYCGPFWFESYEGPPRVFFGHTVLDEPIIDRNVVGLDTGCVYGGALTAYDVGKEMIVSVSAVESYQGRTEAKIIEPE